MQRPGQASYVLPRPGPALKALLIVIAGLAVARAVLDGHGSAAESIAAALVCSRDAVLHGQVWRIVTSGLIVASRGILGLALQLVGLYFLGSALETQWGSRRFLTFFFSAVALGDVVSLAASYVAPGTALFGQTAFFGPDAAVFATLVAWAVENGDARVQLYFLIPIKGRYLAWIMLGTCVYFVATGSPQPEGVAGLFAGVGYGALAAGRPSRLRRAYLQAKLFVLRRRSSTLRASDILAPSGRATPPRRARTASSPPLRVLPGGLEDALKNRKPPKDKRYLN
jgi:membrane associated rhomboid family serine protease